MNGSKRRIAALLGALAADRVHFARAHFVKKCSAPGNCASTCPAAKRTRTTAKRERPLQSSAWEIDRRLKIQTFESMVSTEGDRKQPVFSDPLEGSAQWIDTGASRRRSALIIATGIKSCSDRNFESVPCGFIEHWLGCVDSSSRTHRGEPLVRRAALDKNESATGLWRKTVSTMW